MTESRRPGLLALACGLAVLISRWPVALAHQDTWYPFEVHSGTIARALLDGLELELATLPIVAHVRGSVLFGVLLAPIYAVAGASSLSLKLLPVLWNASAVGLLAWLLARHVGQRAAIAAGLLFAAAPPMLQKLSTLGLASHLESALPWLLCWGAYLAWLRDGASRGRALRFGAALGFAGFFHLQALIPALLLLALLVWRERRRLLGRNGLWLLLGAGVCAAPSFLFASGSLAFLRSRSDAPGAEPEALAKLGGLVAGDLAAALEFGGTPGALGAWLGPLAALGLALGALAGCAALRRQPQTLFFPLHALLVLLLYAASELHVVAEVGAGATNRQLAPAVFALLCCAAVGVERGGLARAPVALLVLAGALGWPALVRGGEAQRLRQRGECYEWFTRQLEREARGDAAAWIELLERVDRGDARFRSLRFAPALTGLDAEATALLAGTAPDGDVDAAGLLRWTALGRALGARVDALVDATRVGALDALAREAREALWHGVGIALQPPRAREGMPPVVAFVERIERLLSTLPAEDARAAAEGYGLQLGFVYEPYNRNLGEVLELHWRLDPRHGAAFARGLGWGARQRYLEPPEALAEGLALAERVDPRVRPAFEEAFAGRVLPREAQAFER